MECLNPSLVAAVEAGMKGARRAKFLASVEVINESLARGGWIKRGRVKATPGFYQGCGIRWNPPFVGTEEGEQDRALSFYLSYGASSVPVAELGEAVSRIPHEAMKGHSRGFVEAWLALCEEKEAALALLDAARPLPVLTPVGLSPRVTATLKEMNLDLDLSSIKMPRIVPVLVPAHPPAKDEDGNPVMTKVYVIEWTPGIQHGRSRFATDGGHCEACGKRIPSGLFVPVEAYDNASGGLVSLWLGCDCARTIFGIQDVGVSKNPGPAPDFNPTSTQGGSIP